MGIAAPCGQTGGVDPEIDELHRRAVTQELDSYLDPVTGCAVFTAAYLAARGSCCASGCRHCPYGDRT